MKFTLQDHKVQEAQQCPSPNFNERPDPEDIRLVVIHCISLPPGEYGQHYIDDLFCNCLDASVHPYFRDIKGLRVSSHFLVRRNGELVQYVDCDQRAWHAGDSCWQGCDNCNDFSIGIELEGSEEQPFEEVQYEVAGTLVASLASRYRGLTGDYIVGHSDIAPGRKNDPGPFFEWDKLRAMISRKNTG